jgi:hypothetical protein
MTLVAAMMDVAVTGLYVDAVAEGFRLKAWKEPQLVALQKQFEEINFLPLEVEAFNSHRAAFCHAFETGSGEYVERLFVIISRTNFWQKLKSPSYVLYTFAPRGWVYQNMTAFAQLEQIPIETFNLASNVVSLANLEKFNNALGKIARSPSPFSFLAATAAGNYIKATQVLLFRQTLVNESLIVCALERYHLAHDEYPETLDALAPQFIEKVPHDFIGGQPLKYHRTDDGKFILYSVGWNEKDDSGNPGSNKGGSTQWDVEDPDWVWKYPAR